MCCVWVSEQTETFAFYNLNRLVLYNRGEECSRTESWYLYQTRFVFKGLKPFNRLKLGCNLICCIRLYYRTGNVRRAKHFWRFRVAIVAVWVFVVFLIYIRRCQQYKIIFGLLVKCPIWTNREFSGRIVIKASSSFFFQWLDSPLGA